MAYIYITQYCVSAQCLQNREEGSYSSNWNESRAVASLSLSLPPCTLQGRAVTGAEEAVHQRGNWPWFIGGQSSQQELAQHWHEARQGHAVNTSKPTNPSQHTALSARTPLLQISHQHAGGHTCEWVHFVFCAGLHLCVPSNQSHTHTLTQSATKNDKQST